jgi:tetratricopeptide (TPR) repeat protein
MSDYSLFDPEELFALIEHDIAKENFEGALLKLKISLSRDKVSDQFYALAGRLYATLKLFGRSKSAFEIYVERNPGHYFELFQLGMVNRDLGDEKEALALWQRVIDIESQYPAALFHSADLLAGQGHIEKATERLNTLLETAPDDSEYIALADQMLTKLSLQ